MCWLAPAFAAHIGDCEETAKNLPEQCKREAAKAKKAASDVATAAAAHTPADPKAGAEAQIATSRSAIAAFEKGKSACNELKTRCKSLCNGIINKNGPLVKPKLAAALLKCDSMDQEIAQLDEGIATNNAAIAQAEEVLKKVSAMPPGETPPGETPPAKPPAPAKPPGAPGGPPAAKPGGNPGGGQPGGGQPGGGQPGGEQGGGQGGQGGGMPQIPPIQPPQDQKKDEKKEPPKPDPVLPIVPDQDKNKPPAIDCTKLHPQAPKPPQCRPGAGGQANVPTNYQIASVCSTTSAQQDPEQCAAYKAQLFCAAEGRMGVCPSCIEGMTKEKFAALTLFELKPMCNAKCVNDPEHGPQLADRCRAVF